jgi:hypothetical protein
MRKHVFTLLSMILVRIRLVWRLTRGIYSLSSRIELLFQVQHLKFIFKTDVLFHG